MVGFGTVVGVRKYEEVWWFSSEGSEEGVEKGAEAILDIIKLNEFGPPIIDLEVHL